MFRLSGRWRAKAGHESVVSLDGKYIFALIMFLTLLCMNISTAGAADCDILAKYSGNYAGDLTGVLTSPSSKDLDGIWNMAVGSDLYIHVEVYDTPILGDLSITGTGTLNPDTGLANMTFSFLGTRTGTGGVDCDGNFFFECASMNFHLDGVVTGNGKASGTWDLSFTYLVKIEGSGTFSGRRLFTAPNLVDWNGNLVADFGGNGLWYNDGSTWHWMSNKGNVGRMVVWNGNLVVDFGAGNGLQYYNGSWNWMSNHGDVAMMMNWDDGTGERLVVDFGAGERVYTYDGSWHWFTNKDGVADMTAWNNKLVVDFGGGRGVFNYDGAWHWMTNKDDVALMLPWNNGGSERLVVDFGAGRDMYIYNGNWNWLTNKDDVNNMTVWNQKLVVDFGAGQGVYNYDTAWHWMTNKDDVARMVPWNDGSAENLAVDFGSGRNMSYYDGSWHWMRNDDNVPEMVAWSNRLAVDFGTGIGIYQYHNGSWYMLRTWSTAD